MGDTRVKVATLKSRSLAMPDWLANGNMSEYFTLAHIARALKEVLVGLADWHRLFRTS